MFLGHYGVAFAARRAVPRASLGATIFAAQWLDELWPILLLAGVESVRIVPGLMAANPLDFVHYPWSHSLLMALVWSAVIGGGYWALRRDRRTALVIGALVASHWLLDLPMHRPDLPLTPAADSARVGLGLWSSVPATYAIELLLFLGGVALYARATRARDRIGGVGLWAMVVLLAALFLAAGRTPPPDERTLAVTTLAIWLFVPWGWWVDRHRDPRLPTTAEHPATTTLAS